MRNIMISGLSERLISKLLPDVDNVELGYSYISGIMLIPKALNETTIVFVDSEQYNRTVQMPVEGVFKILSE